MPGTALDQPARRRAPAVARSRGNTRSPGGSRKLHRGALGQVVNGNSAEARFLRGYEKMLVLHVGGQPSAVERALIIRACRLALFLEKMDERALEAGGVMSQHDSDQYLAWCGNLRRTLVALGLKGQATAPLTLQDYLASKAKNLPDSGEDEAAA